MQFNLPKPLHGWRQFAGEVGIIVLGVMIALGAGQVAETISWHQRADSATEALRKEVGDHYGYASEAVVAQPCIDAQLQVLADAMEGRSHASATLYTDQTHRFVFRAPSRPWSDNKWQSIISEEVASHLNKALRQNLGDHYAQVSIMRENSRATDQLGWRLNALASGATDDPTTRGQLVQEIEEARGRFEYMRLVGNQILFRIQKMNLAPPRDEVDAYLAKSGTVRFCREHHMPLAAVEPNEG